MENNTENKQVANQSHEKTAKQLKKQKVRQTIVSLIGIALILWGVVKVVLLFIDYSSNETSNDAQVEQYISPVNLRASGYIKKICFQEHQSVKKGDTLLILDDREYRIRVVSIDEGFKGNASLFKYARDLGNRRGDMYEIGLWEDSIVESGNDIMYAINIPQESVTIPETMDAIRAATKMQLTREEGTAMTNKYLKIGRFK